MKGTNVDGSTYDDPNVPYASYFNGGDALHGFIRASYGTPQSNGCVEMSYANAALVWPLTPIGTLVTVVGPDFGTAPPPTTTTTTAPRRTTTTLPRHRRPRPRRWRRHRRRPAGVDALSGQGMLRPFGQPFLGVGGPVLVEVERLGLGPSRRAGPALGPEAAQALRHVVGLGIGAEHPLEVLPRLGEVARPLVQVGQQVPLADVALRRVAQGLRSPPAVDSMAMAPLRSPASASEAAATIRPSASTSGSGELCRSSAHSAATFFGLCSARWQSISTGMCSVESLRRPKASRCPAAKRQRPLR